MTTAEMIQQPLVEPPNKTSVVKPFVLSHGTLECYDLKATRRFYEEFLGLECVQHRKRSMVARCGLKFHIACVEVGDKVHPVHMLNHWGVDVRTREEVDAAHEAAVKLKDTYGIREVRNATGQHGVYSFYLVDLDHNWWEIQASESFRHDQLFEGGERSERIARAAQLTNTGNGK